MLGVKLQGLGFLLPPLLGETPVLVWNVTPPSLTVGEGPENILFP